VKDALNKLEKPNIITSYGSSQMPGDQSTTTQSTLQKQRKLASIAEGQAELEGIDVTDDDQIDSTKKVAQEIDVDDEAVKDRWSRYIGAMGVEAVAKQAAASIFLSGAGALGIEIAKNLVLSGCKAFTLHDPRPAELTDLSGQFFINEEAIVGKSGKSDVASKASSLPKLQQLNHYVRCKQAPDLALPHSDPEKLGALVFLRSCCRGFLFGCKTERTGSAENNWNYPNQRQSPRSSHNSRCCLRRLSEILRPLMKMWRSHIRYR